ncbi:MAG: GMC family oxidoreductase N-terminal domain-containing protein [Deltaproteobacteria bacterium]|nr:GMC family oxidoreductase N-terminal domain-containing protein [Deltaproteobacteria bacterium]
MTASAPAKRPGSEGLKVFAQYDRDFEDEADVVVVGSGPCGSVVAHSLAVAGRSVILLEEGPPFTPQDYEFEGSLSMARTMREGGLRRTEGTILPTMQAIALGGGSLVNSAICVRPPEFVFEGWSSRFDLEHTSREALDPHFDAVAEFLGIAPTPENVQGRRNLLMKTGCDALGYSSEPISRNVRGCRGSGECFTGCRARAKQSMDITYIPEALQLGARVLTSVQVQGVLAEGRRAVGVEGQVVEPFTGVCGHRFKIRAKAAAAAQRRSGEPLRAGGQELAVSSRGRDRGDLSGDRQSSVRRHSGLSVPRVLARGFQAGNALGAAGGGRRAHAGFRQSAARALQRSTLSRQLGCDWQHPPLARQRTDPTPGPDPQVALEPPPRGRQDPHPRPLGPGGDPLCRRGAQDHSRGDRPAGGDAFPRRSAGAAESPDPGARSGERGQSRFLHDAHAR